MKTRKIINIDEKKCNGCKACIPNCPEGAIQIIDGKARLISDIFCDGLGACIGHCPQGAITIMERPAEEYNETKVIENIAKQGRNTIIAHLKHLEEHGQSKFLKQAISYLKENGFEDVAKEFFTRKIHSECLCPGMKASSIKPAVSLDRSDQRQETSKAYPHLTNWPIQISLVPVSAPYLKNADIVIAADCVGFAYPSLLQDILKGRVLLIGCPKLDDTEFYIEKLTQIFENNTIKQVNIIYMEVPCCFGLMNVVKTAISNSGKKIPFEGTIIGINGERIEDGRR
jgi:ferredoxin